MPSDTKVKTVGLLEFPKLGSSGKDNGPFPELNVSAKTVFKDAEFSLSVPAVTAIQHRTLTGTTLSVNSIYSKAYALS